MQGTVYKELVQNRFFLLCGLFLPPLAYVAAVLMGLIMKVGAGFSWTDFFSGFLADGALFPVVPVALLAAYSGMRLMAAGVFSQDESKRKSMMMAAVPNGTTRQIYGKYVAVFMACALFLVSALFTDSFFGWIVFCVTGKIPPAMKTLLMLMLFVQMFLRSFDMPFFVRFGTKYGKYVLILFLILAAITIMTTIPYVPVFDKITGLIWDWFSRLMNGESEEAALFIISAFPILSIGAYYLSYRLSCKLWLKGVANYEA